jgi:hypothetical protein
LYQQLGTFAAGKPASVNVIMDQEPPGIMSGYEFM